MRSGVTTPASEQPASAEPLTQNERKVLRLVLEGYLRWSAPGGMNLQFGVLATGRAGADGHAPKWFTRAVPSGNGHRLESFDVAGKPLGPVELSHPVEFNVQVWAHPSENAGK